MNKMYKVIWNKARHCYVVVSEFAKRNSKSVTTKSCPSQSLVAALTVIALCAGMTGVVNAAENNTDGTGLGVAFGSNSNANSRDSVAVGQDTKSGGASVAIGGGAQAADGNSVALDHPQ